MSAYTKGKRWYALCMERAVTYYRVSTRQQQRSGLGIEAKRHKTLVEARFAEMLTIGNIDSPKLRAREIWLLAEGAINCILTHGDQSYAETAKRMALHMIRHPIPGVRNRPVRRVAKPGAAVIRRDAREPNQWLA